MAEPLLEVKGVKKAFGGLQCVNDLSLDVHRGEIVSPSSSYSRPADG